MSIYELHESCRAGNLARVEAFIKQNSEHPFGINKKDDRGQAPLHIAAEGGIFHNAETDDIEVTRGKAKPFLAIVKILLAAGANPNQLDRNGSPPLELACCDGVDEIVEALCEGGADVNLMSVRGRLLLHVLRCHIITLFLPPPSVISPFILDFGGGMTPLCMASRHAQFHCIKVLVEKFGADVNKKVRVFSSFPSYLRSHHFLVDFCIAVCVRSYSTPVCGYDL